MEFQCLQYKNYSFVAKLKKLQEGNMTKLLCLVREVSVRSTPEEMVRQSLLYFLVNNCQELMMEKIVIDVERGDIDIACQIIPFRDDFSPVLPPILIIETKKRDIAQLDTIVNENQLKFYLERKDCIIGILFNCTSMYCYRKEGDTYIKNELTNLSELEYIISTEWETFYDVLSNHYEWVIKAQVGDFVSFRKLVELYGRRSTITFVYERNNIKISTSGFLFDFQDDIVLFKMRGTFTKKKLSFSKDNFCYLISIHSTNAF